MTNTIKSDHIIRKQEGQTTVDEGVVAYVDEAERTYWWIPFPERDERNQRLKHYIKAPRKEPCEGLAKRIQEGLVQLVEHQATGLASNSIEELRERAQKPREERELNLVEALALMDQQWSWIEQFVSRASIETLLDVEAVNRYAEGHCASHGIQARQIVRAVRVYLMRGRTIAALLPGWERSGAAGHPRYPRQSDVNGGHSRPGRRNIAALNGYPQFAGIQATEEVREKLRLGYKKYKTGNQVSVREAYAMTMAEYWADEITITDGIRQVTLKPLEELPTFDQFRRHGPARDPASAATRINLGAHRWERDHRALPGSEHDRVVAAATWGGIDSTSDDQNLVLGVDRTVQLPASWNTKVVEGYTGYILGFYSGFERESRMTSLLAVAQAASSKVALCKRYGIAITDDDWLALHLRRIRSDNGAIKSEAGIEALSRSAISLEFVQSYAAERKGSVESKHQTLHRAVGHQMAGSTQGQRHRRGDENPSKQACRTHGEYMHHAIKGILFHNNEERVERLLTLEMRADHVEPTRASILKWMLKKGYVTTEPANMSMLRAMCLPALKAVLTRKGVHVFDPRSNEERLIPHLRYSSKALQATGLMNCGNGHRQDAIVHINPSAIGKAWLSYRGMVELELQTHDVELETLTLREWLEITDRDRLSRFLTGHKRLSLKANGAIERYDSNEQAQRIKAEHEKNAAALGRAQSSKPSKRAAARMEKQAEKERQLDLDAASSGNAGAPQTLGVDRGESANEPEWVRRARAQSNKQ
jgi:hypothetical protein